MEAATDLFKWGLVIVEVGVEDIDVVQLQPLQGAIETFLDVLPADDIIRVDIRFWGSSDLGGNNDVLSLHLEILEDLAELDLSLTSIVNLGSIKVINPIGQGNTNDFFIDCVVFLLGVDHVAEGDDGGLEAGVSEVTVDHLAGLEH